MDTLIRTTRNAQKYVTSSGASTLQNGAGVDRQVDARSNSAQGLVDIIPIYQLRPRFQDLLRPGVQCLHQRGITANQATLVICLLSLPVSVLVAGSASHLWLFTLIPLWMFLRVALNAVDGMLARELGQKSDLGIYLNELTDVIADSGLYPSFALLPGVNPLWVVLVVLLAAISEYVGALGIMVGASRRHDGPMGKNGRALCFGVIGTGVASGSLSLAWIDWLMLLIATLLLLTIGNRARRGLAELAVSRRSRDDQA